MKIKLSLESQLDFDDPRVLRTDRRSIGHRCKTGVSNNEGTNQTTFKLTSGGSTGRPGMLAEGRG